MPLALALVGAACGYLTLFGPLIPQVLAHGPAARPAPACCSPPSASVVGGLVSMARGIGTTLGISLMALALHLST